MCGIVGYLGNREARQILIDCLGRLVDCRGHDAHGMGVVAGGKLKTLHSPGDNANLKTALKRTPLSGKVGVAHAYRTAQDTSAAQAEHTSPVTVVHDGTVQNSGIVAQLLERDSTDLESALRAALPLLDGEFSLVALSQHEPDRIVAARKGGKPLVIGHHYDGYFVASESPAISHYTRNVQNLEDGEMAVISYAGVTISRFDGTPVQRPPQQNQCAGAQL
jgi:glutamine---fructose-6-phosphate transaminase (isomerizing)